MYLHFNLLSMVQKYCKNALSFAFTTRMGSSIHRGISRGLEELEIVYKPSVDVSESMDLSKIKEVYYESFQSVKQREIFRGTTLIGPHRDDLQFFVNSKMFKSLVRKDNNERPHCP